MVQTSSSVTMFVANLGKVHIIMVQGACGHINHRSGLLQLLEAVLLDEVCQLVGVDLEIQGDCSVHLVSNAERKLVVGSSKAYCKSRLTFAGLGMSPSSPCI